MKTRMTIESNIKVGDKVHLVAPSRSFGEVVERLPVGYRVEWKDGSVENHIDNYLLKAEVLNSSSSELPTKDLVLTKQERKDLMELAGRSAETKRTIDAIDILSDKVDQLQSQVNPQWISVKDHLPKCDKTPDSFGVQVLIWPHATFRGTSDSPIAFYGCRITNEASFYLYGAVINEVTHWQPLPEGPK